MSQISELMFKGVQIIGTAVIDGFAAHLEAKREQERRARWEKLFESSRATAVARKAQRAETTVVQMIPTTLSPSEMATLKTMLAQQNATPV